MPRNIEIKARIASVEALLAAARALADGEAEAIEQDDTFFAVAMGRLKLRQFADGSAELIHYHRADGPEAPSVGLRARAGIRCRRLARGAGARLRRASAACASAAAAASGPDAPAPGPGGGPGRLRRAGGGAARGPVGRRRPCHCRRLDARLGLQHAPRLGGAYLDQLRAAAGSTAP